MECERVLVESAPASEARFGSNTGVSCATEDCLTYTESCEGEECSRTIRHCEIDSNDRDWTISSTGTIASCTLTDREGPQVEGGVLEGRFAQDLIIVFASEATTLEGVPLEQGYNVMQVPSPDFQAWAEAWSCELNARASVEVSSDENTSEERQARIAEAQADCPPGTPRLERLTDPSGRELKISLGDPTQAL
jgi:hypothetical protein